MSVKEKFYVFLAVLSVPLFIISGVEDDISEKSEPGASVVNRLFVCSKPERPGYSIRLEEIHQGEYAISEVFERGGVIDIGRSFLAISEVGPRSDLKTYVFSSSGGDVSVEITEKGYLSHILDPGVAANGFPFVCVDPREREIASKRIEFEKEKYQAASSSGEGQGLVNIDGKDVRLRIRESKYNRFLDKLNLKVEIELIGGRLPTEKEVATVTDVVLSTQPRAYRQWVFFLLPGMKSGAFATNHRSPKPEGVIFIPAALIGTSYEEVVN